jgi:hypothetical protein
MGTTDHDPGLDSYIGRMVIRLFQKYLKKNHATI